MKAIIACLKEWWINFKETVKPFLILTDYKNLKYFKTLKILNKC